MIETKSGREAILAKTVIDCTGDADVAFRAGVQFHKGDEKGGMQPPTLMFSMKGVDVCALRDAIVNHSDEYDMDTMPAEQFRKGKFITVGFRNQILKARSEGYNIPVARTILITGMADDEIWVNMSRVNGTDSTDPASYTFGEVEARKQIYEIERYLKDFIPGFSEAWMDKIAPFMGIRESRVIEGKYVLTAEDIHHSVGDDCTLYWCEDCYDLPYRMLLPDNTGNLLVAGSCSWETNRARHCNWVRIRDRRTGQEFRVLDVHLDHKSEEARCCQSHMIVEESAQYADDFPQILCGDFNAGLDQKAVTTVKNAGWTDAYEALHTPEQEVTTCHLFMGENRKVKKVKRIDFIFFRGNINVKQSSIVKDSRNGIYPSDHYFVLADLEINSKN